VAEKVSGKGCLYVLLAGSLGLAGLLSYLFLFAGYSDPNMPGATWNLHRLGLIDEARTVDLLLTSLSHGNDYARMQAIPILGEMGGEAERAAGPIQGVMRENLRAPARLGHNTDLVVISVRALGQLQDRRSVGALAGLVCDESRSSGEPPAPSTTIAAAARAALDAIEPDWESSRRVMVSVAYLLEDSSTLDCARELLERSGIEDWEFELSGVPDYMVLRAADRVFSSPDLQSLPKRGRRKAVAPEPALLVLWVDDAGELVFRERLWQQVPGRLRPRSLTEVRSVASFECASVPTPWVYEDGAAAFGERCTVRLIDLRGPWEVASTVMRSNPPREKRHIGSATGQVSRREIVEWAVRQFE